MNAAIAILRKLQTFQDVVEDLLGIMECQLQTQRSSHAELSNQASAERVYSRSVQAQ
jgi:hypothetical protein